MEPIALTNSQIWQDMLINYGLPLIGALFAFLSTLLTQYLLEKTKAIKDKRLRDALEFALKRVDETAETVVKEIGQTLVNRGHDGKVLQQGALREEALKRVQDRIPVETMGMLKEKYGAQLTPIIIGKIESKIKEC